MIINPDWIERPTPQTIAASYPSAARAAGIAGRAVVQCLVGVDGQNHDCQVVEEIPAGQGFGDAALALAKQYVMVPMKRDCVPVDGGRVRFPFSFGAQAASPEAH
jgi:periplasmic protein TonB